MHIVLVSDHETHGGAAVAASRLATELAREHRITRLVRFPEPSSTGRGHPWRTIPLGEPDRWTTWAGKVGRRFFPERFPYPHTPAFLHRRLAALLRRLRPDVINLHNLHAGTPWGWDPSLVGVCADAAPVVWTLHDMWSFTGRCAYAYDCVRFRCGCDASCPTAEEAPALAPERIAPAWWLRQELFRTCSHLVAVTPSRWLAEVARSGLWRNHRVETIPYGLPLDNFRPLPRTEARRALGLPEAGPVVLLAACDLTERRKGGHLLPEVWEQLRGLSATFLQLGRGTIASPLAEHRTVSLGWVEDDAVKVLVYNAADVLLHPAPVDNYPNVLLEALACGTPAVGFAVGGIPEIVQPGRTGWLAERVEAASLAGTLRRALADIAYGNDLRASARAAAVAQWAAALQAERYAGLFLEAGKPKRMVEVAAKEILPSRR